MDGGGVISDPRGDPGGRSRRDAALKGLVGDAPAFLEAISNLDAIAKSDLPVLLTGERGTGKELVARRIHALSERASFPFIAVNCALLWGDRLEDNLFGHVRGAFTGAETQRRGLIAAAQDGTLFLDEVEALSPGTQMALLRVLQDGMVRPVGGDVDFDVDSRCIAATNAPISELVARGAFREDLYDRIAGFAIHLPPLRDRRSDIPLLARSFLSAHGHSGGLEHGLGPEFEAALLSYDWPGNVRELEYAIRRAIALARGGPVKTDHLVLRRIDGGDPSSHGKRIAFMKRRAMATDAWEHGELIKLLAKHHGNVTAAARAADLGRRTLQRLLTKHSLDPTMFNPNFSWSRWANSFRSGSLSP